MHSQSWEDWREGTHTPCNSLWWCRISALSPENLRRTHTEKQSVQQLACTLRVSRSWRTREVGGATRMGGTWGHMKAKSNWSHRPARFWNWTKNFNGKSGISKWLPQYRSLYSCVAQLVKNLPAMREIQVHSLGREDPLEEEMATHSSILAWRIPWTEEPGGLQSTASRRVGHDWEANTRTVVLWDANVRGAWWRAWGHFLCCSYNSLNPKLSPNKRLRAESDWEEKSWTLHTAWFQDFL